MGGNPLSYIDPTGRDWKTGLVGAGIGGLSGYLGSLATGGSQSDALAAAGIGAVMGGIIGTWSPESGLATIGGLSAAVGDALGQGYTILNYKPPANSCSAELPPRYNPYQTIGAGIGGALGGLLPADALAPLIATSPISWGLTTAGSGIGMKLGQ